MFFCDNRWISRVDRYCICSTILSEDADRPQFRTRTSPCFTLFSVFVRCSLRETQLGMQVSLYVCHLDDLFFLD
jgi:hypothetical protein